MHAPQVDPTKLTDAELIHRLQALLAHERKTTARLLMHLAEVDARGLYREHAYGSMFEYCVAALHMSESEAYVRIRAARMSREYPVVLGMLERGELHLSAIKLLGPVLTVDNHAELLEDARFKSKREIELMLARRFAKPDVPSVIRKIAGPTPAALNVAHLQGAPVLQLGGEVAAPGLEEPPARAQAPSVTPVPEQPMLAHQPPASRPAHPADAIAPLSSDRYKVQFTASERLRRKLEQARELMRHQVPDGDLATVCERALDLLIAERMKQRFATTTKPRSKDATSTGTGTRHIPHAVRRAVLERDGARCTYVSGEGRRCEQRGYLELHHEQPHGRGGDATAENIRLVCRAHNRLLAERDYGRDVIEQRIRAGRRERGGDSSRDELNRGRSAEGSV